MGNLVRTLNEAGSSIDISPVIALFRYSGLTVSKVAETTDKRLVRIRGIGKGSIGVINQILEILPEHDYKRFSNKL